MKLTKATLARVALPEGKTDHVVWDDELAGFGLRLRAGGARTWIVRYRVGTAQRVQKLGRVETLDADKARAEARQILARKDLGQDPQADKVAARAGSAITLATVVQDYITRHVEPRLKARSAVGGETASDEAGRSPASASDGQDHSGHDRGSLGRAGDRVPARSRPIAFARLWAALFHLGDAARAS